MEEKKFIQKTMNRKNCCLSVLLWTMCWLFLVIYLDRTSEILFKDDWISEIDCDVWIYYESQDSKHHAVIHRCPNGGRITHVMPIYPDCMTHDQMLTFKEYVSKDPTSRMCNVSQSDRPIVWM